MIQKIADKYVKLSKLRPFTPEVNHYLARECRIDWIWCDLRLEGSAVSREQIEQILAGELVREIHLGEYARIDSYWKLFPFLNGLLDMETELSEPIFRRLYDHLASDNQGYRRSNPILRQWNYNPPHFKDVEEQMGLLFHWYANASYPGNPLMKAVVLHDKILEIYPFGDDSCTMARLALLYHLLYNGLYPFVLNMGEQEYHDSMREYLKKEDCTMLYHAVERGVFNRLEILLQMMAE